MENKVYPRQLTFFKGSKNGGGAISIGTGDRSLFFTFVPHVEGRYDFKGNRTVFKLNVAEIGRVLELFAAKYKKDADGKAPQESTLAHFTEDKQLSKVMSITYSDEYKAYALSVYDAINKKNVLVPIRTNEAIIIGEYMKASIPFIFGMVNTEERDRKTQTTQQQPKNDLPTIDLDKVDETPVVLEKDSNNDIDVSQIPF